MTKLRPQFEEAGNGPLNVNFISILIKFFFTFCPLRSCENIGEWVWIDFEAREKFSETFFLLLIEIVFA